MSSFRSSGTVRVAVGQRVGGRHGPGRVATLSASPGAPMVNPVQRVVRRGFAGPTCAVRRLRCPTGSRSANLFFGVFAIVTASHADSSRRRCCTSCWAACATPSTAGSRARRAPGSRFGVELDSLVDAISFGLAPAMIIYFSVLDREGGAWWLLVFLFTACAVIRLARFNIAQGGDAKTPFPGTAEPGRGGHARHVLLVQPDAALQPDAHRRPAVARHGARSLMGGLAILMITTCRTRRSPRSASGRWSGLAGLVVVIGSICRYIYLWP